MQLHFTVGELKLLVEVLQSEDSATAEHLLDMVLARDMRFAFDELEDLAEIVSKALQSTPVTDPHDRRTTLQRILDKLIAACAMA
ncbi:MAG: hypothetical protein ACE14L_06340 [Terriglobales bacterium]